MSNVAKLKKKAAEFEQKKQFDKALTVYLQILEESGGGDDEDIDVALYNRVGDLMLRQGQVSEAVDYYEKAADLYAEGGFFNNAIALCNKILRQSPGRTSIYYKLGKISAQKGFKSDAKQNFLEYADRMQKAGQIDEAFRALKEFADLCPDQDDIRLMLADQLAKRELKDEALQQLQTLYDKFEAEGRDAEARATADRMKAIDPTIQPRASGNQPTQRAEGLVFLDVSYDQAAAAPPAKRPSVPTARPSAATPRPSAATGRPTVPPKVHQDTPAPGRRPTKPDLSNLPLLEVPEPLEEPAASAAPLDLEPTSFGDMGGATGGLDGISHGAGMDVEAPPSADSGSLLGIEHTSFEAPPPPRTSRVSRTEMGEITLDLPPELAPPLDSDASGSGDIPLLDSEIEVPPTPPAGLDLIMPDDMPAAPAAGRQSGALDFDLGGTLDLEPTTQAAEPPTPASRASTGLDLDLGGFDMETPAAAEASSPAADLPLMDIDEPPARRDSVPTKRPSTGVPADRASAGVPEITLDDLSVADAPVADAVEASADLDLEMPTEPPKRRASTSVLMQSADLLRAQLADNDADWALHRQLGEALLDGGERDAGLDELEKSMVGFEKANDLESARSVAEEILLLKPDSVRHLQKRVEYAFRTNDKPRLIEAYVELGDTFVRAGQPDKARAVYQRVLDLAPGEPRATAAIATFSDAPIATEPPAPRESRREKAPTGASKRYTTEISQPAASAAPPRANDEFVNLGDWLREDEGPKNTRMVVEEKQPTGDEQADFSDMLKKFKQGVAENVEDEDYDSHYDLGVAYKEMGLLDESIAEFQKALRGHNRVRTYEALGNCFIEKGQHSVAGTVLKRALSEPGLDDEKLVGVLYLLGIAAEAQGKTAEAISFFQRVFSVDIQFRDVGDRLNALENVGS